MKQRYWRIAGTLLALSLTLGGCAGESEDPGSDETGETDADGRQTDDSETPVEDVTCPYDDFVTVFTPTDWTAGFVSVCHTADQSAVLLINSSAVFLDIAPNGGTTLGQTGFPQDDAFASVVSQNLAQQTPVSAGHKLVPPGGWVVASGQPASVAVGLPKEVLGVTYAADKLSGFVLSRLTKPDRAMAKRVATCVREVGTAWANVQDPSVQLDFLLADTALGAGRSCGPLISELSQEPNQPPKKQASALKVEFSRLKSSIKGSVMDDLIRMARNYVTVLR